MGIMPTRFDPEVLRNDPRHRGQVLEVLEEALAAVDPAGAVRRHLIRAGETLRIGDSVGPVPAGRIVILALGKASVPMAASALAVLEGLPVVGVVVAPSPAEVPGLDVIVGGHPLPDAGSLAGGRRLLDAAAAAGPEDLVLVLVSGGASALAEVPLPGVTLADVRKVSDALFRVGAPITEVNTVRRHLSALKGGRLGAAASPSQLATLVVSDVVGSPLEAIAGGPSVPDPTTSQDALAVLRAHGIEPPSSVLEVLGSSPRDEAAPAGSVTVVADGRRAAEGAAAAARRLGIRVRVGSVTLEGEARRVGDDLASSVPLMAPGSMVVHAGETTVVVAGTGVGGRNHEVALAAGVALADGPSALVASFGTDGVDGPSGAAGAIGDSATTARGRELGLDAATALADNDSATFLGATGDQIRCSPTGTNVGDVMVVYRGDD
jgi:glycerate 2-kinase